MIRPVVTAACEGGMYSPAPDPKAPIRIYHDRRVQDDIYTRISGKKWRSRFTRQEFRQVKKAAKLNRAEGYV